MLKRPLESLELIVKLWPTDVMENSSFKVKTIVIKAQSYNVLVGAMILYPMGFYVDFWENITY
jgi:hypothetical protein